MGAEGALTIPDRSAFDFSYQAGAVALELEIFGRGSLLHRETLEPWQVGHFALASGDATELRLRASRTFVPSEHGNPGDERSLSIRVQSLRLEDEGGG